MSGRVLLLAITCLSAVTMPLAAGPVVYTDLTSWTAAVSNPTTATFNDLTDGQYVGNGTYDGIGVSDVLDWTSVWGPMEGGCYSSDSGSDLCLEVDNQQPTTLTLPGAEAAFALDLGMSPSANPTNPATFQIAGTTALGAVISQSISVPQSTSNGSGYTFIGFTLDPGDTISSFTVNDTATYQTVFVDNVAYASDLSGTPEPGTLGLLLGGFGVLFFAVRRFVPVRS